MQRRGDERIITLIDVRTGKPAGYMVHGVVRGQLPRGPFASQALAHANVRQDRQGD